MNDIPSHRVTWGKGSTKKSTGTNPDAFDRSFSSYLTKLSKDNIIFLPTHRTFSGDEGNHSLLPMLPVGLDGLFAASVAVDGCA
jgi:hypothetical protein